MGLLHRAVETYDYLAPIIAGVAEDGKEPLAPIGHMIVNSKLEMIINADGRFVAAMIADEKIVIPCTEDSSSRSGMNASDMVHPLCERIDYILDGTTQLVRTVYMNSLCAWCDSQYTHPKLKAVRDYLTQNTMFSDLVSIDIIRDKKIPNLIVRWVVIGLGENSGPVWTDGALHALYTKYIMERLAKSGSDNLCMISGTNGMITRKHPRGIVALHGNARLISANDKKNFTYRGRFTSSDEAVTIGYEASQKAHNSLKWLIANQSSTLGGRTFLCWNPHGKSVLSPQSSMALFEQPVSKLAEYKKRLCKVVAEAKADLLDFETVVIAAFDAATTGRLALTYYSEYIGKEYIDRLSKWDEICCWYDGRFGIQSPGLARICVYAFGGPTGNAESVDDKILSQQMQRLIACKVDEIQFPVDVMRLLLQRASNLKILSNEDKQIMLFITCAVIRKYLYDWTGEEWKMVVEPHKKDRSYQYGRLLAVLEKIEGDFLFFAHSRTSPSALRLQTMYVQRPCYTKEIILSHIKSVYFYDISERRRNYYERLVRKITDELDTFPDSEQNNPLTETYLIGYHLQWISFYESRKRKKTRREKYE